MKTLVFGSLFLWLLILAIPVAYCSGEIDASTVVTQVIYGDTFQTETEGVIKLADVDPTCADIDNATSFLSAKSILESLIQGKTIYLDIDNLYGTDYSGTGNRTVAVVYVDFNSTHYFNVNYQMREQRLLATNDQDNDFNPDDWTGYVKKQDIPEFQTKTLILVFITAFVVAVIGLKKRDKNVF